MTTKHSPGDRDCECRPCATQREKMRQHVARVVAEFPPLTDAQCQRIADLLMAGR